MRSTVEWANLEQTILLVRHPVGFRVDDLVESARRARLMLDEIDHVAHTIVDFQGGNIVPRDFLSNFRRLNEAAPNTHPNFGHFIIIAGPLIRGFAEIFTRLFNPIYAVASEEEAHALLAELIEADTTPV